MHKRNVDGHVDVDADVVSSLQSPEDTLKSRMQCCMQIRRFEHT